MTLPDIILRPVDGRGWLPILRQPDTGRELYRGEFHFLPSQALDAAVTRWNAANQRAGGGHAA